MNPSRTLDASALLARVAQEIPPGLRANVIVIGSIAAAWAFRDISGTDSVATKDIDLLLRPALDAVATAQTLGHELIAYGCSRDCCKAANPARHRRPTKNCRRCA